MEVPAENQIIAVSPSYLNLLRNSKELTKFMAQGDYDKNVSFKLTEYEGRKLVVVPPQRFNTGVKLHANGFSLTGSPIDFMIMPKDAIIHIVKYNKVKVLDGDLALAASNQDGFVVYARVYHDVFVTKNKRIAIYAHTGAFATLTDAQKGNRVLLSTNGGKVASIEAFPFEMKIASFEKVASASAGNVKLGEAKPSGTEVTVGTALTSGDVVYAVNEAGIVVAKTVYTA